ncbi:MAG: hypothetical protein OXG05_08335 [Gammaproteobacteria bacterium]|nr:hypothetical protein [Gammaproteobacteria bacterium]
MRNTTLAIAVALALFSTSIQAQDYEPTENYDILTIGGFTVLVSGDAMYQRPEDTLKALWVLRSQIAIVNDGIGEFFDYRDDLETFEQIYQVVIWLDDSEAGLDGAGPCGIACFYGSVNFLEREGLNPDKAFSVGFTDIEWLIGSSWCCSYVLIHELAHGWHYHVIRDGFENDLMEDAYDRAVDSGLYDDVRSTHERTGRAYALIDAQVFFAVISAALWHHSHEYPYTLDELRAYDEDTFRAVYFGWTLPDQSSSSRPPGRYPELDGLEVLREWNDEKSSIYP